MEQKVGFYSDGLRIAGMLYEPDAAGERSCPGIVMCQGMVGVKEYYWCPTIARHFADLGCVVLIWDYRGVGESEGEPGRLYPLEQAEDIRNALTYLELQPKVDPERLALLGWSFGGGMVPYVAGVDQRVKCAMSAVGWADGGRWMRGMRRYGEWLEFLDRIAEDRRSRVKTGKSEILGPGEILVPDPKSVESMSRARSKIPEMEDHRSTPYSLATAEKIMEFSPMAVVDRISPRPILYIAAEKDINVPAEQIMAMYERTREPKKLMVIPGIVHSGVYEEPHFSQVLDVTTDWLKEHLSF